MREKIDTIPLNEAFRSRDECPLCYLERIAMQKLQGGHPADPVFKNADYGTRK